MKEPEGCASSGGRGDGAPRERGAAPGEDQWRVAERNQVAVAKPRHHPGRAVPDLDGIAMNQNARFEVSRDERGDQGPEEKELDSAASTIAPTDEV